MSRGELMYIHLGIERATKYHPWRSLVNERYQVLRDEVGVPLN